jgi:hypothetical protein
MKGPTQHERILEAFENAPEHKLSVRYIKRVPWTTGTRSPRPPGARKLRSYGDGASSANSGPGGIPFGPFFC